MKPPPAARVPLLRQLFLESTTRPLNVVPNAGFSQIKGDSLSEDPLLTSSKPGRECQLTVALACPYIKAAPPLFAASSSGKPDIPPGVNAHLHPSLLEPLFL